MAFFLWLQVPRQVKWTERLEKLKKEVYAPTIAGEFKLTTNTVTPIASGTKYHFSCNRYRLYKAVIN
jgi:hypothetical protein